MKLAPRCLIALAAFLAIMPASHAQVEVGLQTGYSFGALVSTPYEQVRLDPGQWYGAVVDYHLRRDVQLEVSYVYRHSTITERTGSPWQPGRTAVLGNLETHYLQGGTIKTFHSSSNAVVPFVGGNVGLSWFTSTIQGTSTDVFLAVSGVGGAKIYLTDNIGVRLQGRLLMPIFWGSLGFFCGSGGCSAGAGGSGTVEGELSGGLFFSF
jgi:hypothetical protein